MAEQDFRGVRRDLAEARTDFSVEPLVRHPHRAVAVCLGEPRALDELRNGHAAKQQQLKGHLPPFSAAR
jgi:hypothetical protein